MTQRPDLVNAFAQGRPLTGKMKDGVMHYIQELELQIANEHVDVECACGTMIKVRKDAHLDSFIRCVDCARIFRVSEVTR